jgi:hypothetical protein
MPSRSCNAPPPRSGAPGTVRNPPRGSSVSVSNTISIELMSRSAARSFGMSAINAEPSLVAVNAAACPSHPNADSSRNGAELRRPVLASGLCACTLNAAAAGSQTSTAASCVESISVAATAMPGKSWRSGGPATVPLALTGLAMSEPRSAWLPGNSARDVLIRVNSPSTPKMPHGTSSACVGLAIRLAGNGGTGSGENNAVCRSA